MNTPNVTLVSDAEAEQCAFRVCASKRVFFDDVQAFCAFCGAPIFHRPTGPHEPAKVCLDCFVLRRLPDIKTFAA